MSFRKRNVFICSHNTIPVVDITTDPDGIRNTSRLTDSEYFVKHPIPTEEFTLEEMLSSGVPVKEIPCSTLLNDDHGNFSCEDDEQILANLETQTKVDNPNDILTNE